jgi:hypothetical protein
MSNITLCRTWKNAVLNEYGVFLKNMLTFECAEENRPGIGASIHCAMKYPKVYVEFSLSASLSQTGALPDRDSMNFDVHDSASDVMRLVTNAIEERAKTHNVPKNLIRGALDKMKNAITDVCIDSVDEEKALDELEKDCFPTCKTCGEEYVTLLDNGNCVECDYKIKHPEAQKKYCRKCIHFRNHDLYDENDHTERCCKLHLEGKDDDEWSYLCRDYIDADILGYKINEKLIQYAPSGRTSVPCEECRQKARFLYDGLCLPCYKKKLQKANEIKRSFEAEGWKEVPEAERENAISGNCWIDERNMDPMEPRKGTRFFIIDTKQLKWSCYFRTQIKKV